MSSYSNYNSSRCFDDRSWNTPRYGQRDDYSYRSCNSSYEHSYDARRSYNNSRPPSRNNNSSRSKVCFRCGISHVDSSFKCDAPFDPSIFHKMKELSRLADNVFEEGATDVAVHERLFGLSKKFKPTTLWSKPVHKIAVLLLAVGTHSPHILRFLPMGITPPSMSTASYRSRSPIPSLSTLLACMCSTSNLTLTLLPRGSTTTLPPRTKMVLASLSLLPRMMCKNFVWDSNRTHTTRSNSPEWKHENQIFYQAR